MTSDLTPSNGTPGLSSLDKLPGYSERRTCRFCEGTDLSAILDFGDVPLAGAFLAEDDLDEEVQYPLKVQFCRTCKLVQVTDLVSADVLFGNYFYFSSAIQTLREHFRNLANELAEKFSEPGNSLVVEIGCNDGVLLEPLNELGIECVGVDPASNVVASANPELRIVNDCFTETTAKNIYEERGGADVIVSSYSFAHIDDMLDVMRGVKALLKEDGVLIVEVYYLGVLLDELQYDMIYHEHMSYYSLMALQWLFQRFGMEVFDVQRISLRAGTLRFYARNIGARDEPISPAINDLQTYELERGMDREETYREFGERVHETKVDLIALLDDLKERGERIIGYGASGRATVIMNYCNIGSQYLDFVVDDAPAKEGFYTPGTHLLIQPWSAAEDDPPPYALLFAWSFIDEVKKRRASYLEEGGHFIVPLPSPEVVGA
jgi:methylation protein EvaC